MNDTHLLSWAGHIVESEGLSGPSMRCLCGFDTGPRFDWEDAGLQLDTHIQQES